MKNQKMIIEFWLQQIIISSLLIKASSASLQKCCADGEVVQHNSELVSREPFRCVRKISVQRTQQDHAPSFPTQLIAYNVLVDGESHWPSCLDNSFLSFITLNGSAKASQSASCVDTMNSDYFIFTCVEGPEIGNDFHEIYRLRKCCEKDYSYDIATKKCLVNSEMSLRERFDELLHDKIIAFETGLPDCKSNDVLVEYHSNVHKLSIYESSLIMTDSNSLGPVVVSSTSYCIESSLKSEVDLPDGVKAESFQLKLPSKWMAKVCRPKTICDRMPCIRKCCNEGQRMVYDTATYCEKHDGHLNVKFHLMDKAPESVISIEPTGV